MSDDDKEYLRKHNIHLLLDSLAKDIIEKRPDNPQQFVVDWLKDKESKEGAPEEAGGDGKKARGRPAMKISVPDAPQRINATGVKEFIEGKGDVVVVDVREECTGGSIAGAVHIPCEDVVRDVAKYADEWKGKHAVVFCSSQSPDLDQRAALSLLPSLSDVDSPATVFTLVGGLVGWMREFGTDAALTQGYDAAKWAQEGEATP
eukprot:TRINITY_DN14449_c0_g1_i1.p1 TRINITY_DN14449_c0_g1~~TRINITY_DN14449_c0_g1_i1.p1  ORF type:complete len:204 (+),score=75.90 TRINITY_DN14449_c0_g1_i1:89-700(+)